MKEGKEEASRGGRGGAREERGMKGDRDGGKLHRMYPEEDTGQYTVWYPYSIQHTKQHTTRPLPLRLW